MGIERFAYATITQRLLAVAADFMVGIAVWYPTAVFTIHTTNWIIPYSGFLVLFAFYEPVLHAVYGQTLGKMIVKIHVRTLDGERIRWSNAFMRSGVDLARVLAQVVAVNIAWFGGSIAPGPYRTLGEFGAVLVSLPMVAPLRHFGNIWSWSEILTMLFNKRRRAIHDYLGGTMVLRRLPDA